VKKLFAVAIGGSIGALIRYQFVSPGDEIGLFLVNTLGVLVAGLFAYRIHNSELATAFWIPGFAGGLTTFSSVALILAETDALKAITYFYGTVAASIALLYLIKPKVRS
jgi:fluoride ion exporter CrcB/FEX